MVQRHFIMLAFLTVSAVVSLLVGCAGGGGAPAGEPGAGIVGAVGTGGEAATAAVEIGSDGRAHVLVGLRHAVGSADRRLVESVGGSVKASYHIIPALAAHLPEKAVEALRRNPNVAYVEGDARMQALEDSLPWGINQVDAEMVWGGAPGAASIAAGAVTGDGVKVAIIDTGIDATHPDLADNYAGGVNCITGGSPADDNGHGTHCAGIVAAIDNDLGVIGVAPKVRLYAVKVLDSTAYGYYSDFIEGLQWAADNGMRVASMSLGGTTDSISLRGACDAAYARNVLVVAAAGNSGAGTDTVLYPAKYDSVIAVAATDSANNRASFSSTGPSVELAAPGVGILSTVLNGLWASKSGTSMACPHVSGVAALVIHSGVSSAAAVRQALQSTATDLGAAGRDSSFGFGLVNAAAAVQSAPPPVDNPPTVSLLSPAEGATVSATVSLSATANDDHGVSAVEFRVDGALVGTDSESADGWSCLWDSSTVADGRHTVQAVATDTAQQTAGDTSSITVQNAAPAPATGGLAGKVTTAGKPAKAIARAQVTAVSSVSGESFVATTDGGGAYELVGVPVGSYQVTAAAPGYQPRTLSAEVVAGKKTRLSFALPAG